MKTVIIISLLLGSILVDFNDIATINTLKEEAERAYKSGNFKVSFL